MAILFITGFLLINPFLVGSDYIPCQLQLLKLPHLIHPHCHQIWEPHWPAMMLPHSECEQGPLKASYSKAMRKVQCWHNVATICESCQHRICSCGGEALLGKDSRSGCQRNQSVCMCKYECAHACLLVFACMTIWQIGIDLNSVIYTNYCLSHVILFFRWTLYEHKTGKGVHRQKQERRQLEKMKTQRTKPKHVYVLYVMFVGYEDNNHSNNTITITITTTNI